MHRFEFYSLRILFVQLRLNGYDELFIGFYLKS